MPGPPPPTLASGGPAAPARCGDRAERAVRVATGLVVLLGAALRVRQWAHGRAFWLDELLLQRAMSQQKLTQLLEPLGFAQSAPPGWLAVQHVVLGLSGSDERAARLLPLLVRHRRAGAHRAARPAPCSAAPPRSPPPRWSPSRRR